MTPREARIEFAGKLEALVHEYGPLCHPYDPSEHSGCHPPDWSHPLSLQNWVLIVAVDDDQESNAERGYWTYGFDPDGQRPYVTEGLIDHYLNLEDA